MKRTITLLYTLAFLGQAILVDAQDHVEELLPTDALVSGIVHGSRYHIDSAALDNLESLDLLREMTDSTTLWMQWLLDPARAGIAPRSDWGFFLDTGRVAGLIWPLSDPERWFGQAVQFAGVEASVRKDFRFPASEGESEWIINKSGKVGVKCWPNFGAIVWWLDDSADSTQQSRFAFFEFLKNMESSPIGETEAFQVLERDFAPHLTLMSNRKRPGLETLDSLPDEARFVFEAIHKINDLIGYGDQQTRTVTGIRFDAGRIHGRTLYEFKPPFPPELVAASMRPEPVKRMWRHVPAREPALFLQLRMDFPRVGEEMERMIAREAASDNAATRTAWELADLFLNEELLKDLWGGAFALSVEGTLSYFAEEEVTTYDANFDEQVSLQTVEKKWPRMVMAWDYGDEDAWLRLMDILDSKNRLRKQGKAWRLALTTLPGPLYLYFRRGIAVLTNDARLAKRRCLPRKERLQGAREQDVADNVFLFHLDLPQVTAQLSEVLGSADVGAIAGLIPIRYIQVRQPRDQHPYIQAEQEIRMEDDSQDGLMSLLQFLDGFLGPIMSNLGGFEKS